MGQLALAIEIEALAVGDIAGAAVLPMSQEEVARRILALLEIVRYDLMEHDELHKQAYGQIWTNTRDQLNALACLVVMEWRSLINEAHIRPTEVAVWNDGNPPEYRTEPIPEEFREGLRAYIAYFNQLNDEARKRYLQLETPELEAHVLALIEGTATVCYHNKMLRAKDKKAARTAEPTPAVVVEPQRAETESAELLEHWRLQMRRRSPNYRPDGTDII